jgi:hypothetical protein
MIGFEDCGGSTSSPLGAERFCIVGCFIGENIKRKERVK